MSKKITHEQARQHLENKIKDGNILTVLEYIKQQERLDNELTNTMIIANSRLERLNGLELEFDKQQKLLDLYKKLSFAWEERFDYSNGEQRIRDLQKQIKDLENDS